MQEEKNYYGYVYTVLVVIITIVLLKYEITIHNIWASYGVHLVYYGVSVFGIFSLYISSPYANTCRGIVFVSSLLMIYYQVDLTPVGLLAVGAFKLENRKKDIWLRVGLISIVFVGFAMSMLPWNISRQEEISRVPNIDGTVDCVIYYQDQGYYGEFYSLHIEKDYYDLISVKKELTLVESGTHIYWEDHHSLKVGGEVIDVDGMLF